MRLFFHLAGTVKARWYQSSLSLPTLFCTPERLDSAAKGTSISPSKDTGLDFPTGRMAYSHKPLRFCHSARSIIGLGYSGNTLFTSISDAHLVFNLSPAGCHWAERDKMKSNEKKNETVVLIKIYYWIDNFTSRK